MEQLDRTKIHPICVASCPSHLTDRLQQIGIDSLIVPFPAILNVYNEAVFAYSLFDKIKSVQALLDYNARIAGIGQQYQVRGIWGRNVKSILLLGLAARWLQVPLVWDIGMEKESRGLMKILHWLGLNLAASIVTQAASQPQEIFGSQAQRFASKFITIPPGVSLAVPVASHRAGRCAEQTIRSIDSPPVILMVGTVNPRKNQLMLLRAVADLYPKYPLCVRIAGPITDESYFSTCQDFMQSAGLTKIVEFLGWRNDIAQLMQQSQLLVLCSQNEGVPHVLREAMQAGLTPIATAVGGIPEVIEHGKTGFLIERNNVDQLRLTIQDCLTHPEICVRMGHQAAEAAVQKFSWTAWSNQYNLLLQKLCQV
jgi:glycosyltransferase involved in cell wall biosynthesis